MNTESKLQPYDFKIRQWKSQGMSNAQITEKLAELEVVTTRQNVGAYCRTRKIKKHDPAFYPELIRNNQPQQETTIESEGSNLSSEASEGKTAKEVEANPEKRQESARARIARRKRARDEESKKGLLDDLEAEKERERKRLLGE